MSFQATFGIILLQILILETKSECPALSKCICEQDYQDEMFTMTIQCTNVNKQILEKDVEIFQNKSNGPQGGVQSSPVKSQHHQAAYEIRVKNSKLTGLEALPTTFAKELRYLTFINTNLTKDELKKVLEPLENLQELRVEGHNLTKVTGDMFSRMKKLESVCLKNSNIERIDPNAFQGSSESIKKMHLNENKLTEFPLALLKLSELEEIDLKDNPMAPIPDDTARILAKALPKLKTLEMEGYDCSCKNSKSEFFSWVQTQGIEKVKCGSPDYVAGREVVELQPGQSCGNSAVGNIVDYTLILGSVLLMLRMF